MTYIALLRGINVGGHIVKMDRLRELFALLGFANARTYIQSGNVFFDSPDTNVAQLTRRIEAHLKTALGYPVPVCLRTATQLESLLASSPFKDRAPSPDERFCIVFSGEAIPAKLALPMSSPKHDMDIIAATAQEAFVVWHIINGRPPSGNFLEKTIGPNITSRFFHTTAKILAAAQKST